jgi:hypothetical protein
VSEATREGTEARVRSPRWMHVFWEGATPDARGENRKEKVLWVFRELARDSEHEDQVRKYGPWEPSWR